MLKTRLSADSSAIGRQDPSKRRVGIALYRHHRYASDPAVLRRRPPAGLAASGLALRSAPSIRPRYCALRGWSCIAIPNDRIALDSNVHHDRRSQFTFELEAWVIHTHHKRVFVRNASLPYPIAALRRLAIEPRCYSSPRLALGHGRPTSLFGKPTCDGYKSLCCDMVSVLMVEAHRRALREKCATARNCCRAGFRCNLYPRVPALERVHTGCMA
jgi:hypothetical protein